MKIPLKYKDRAIVAALYLDIPRLRIRLKAIPDAIIDTGSPETLISEGHALKFGIPTHDLNFAEHISLGGAKFELFELGEATIKLKDEKEQFNDFNFKRLCLAKSTKRDQASIQASHAMPMIIGVNFLEEHKLSLYFAPHKNIVFLEKES